MRVWAIVGDGVPLAGVSLLLYSFSDWKFEAIVKISGECTSKFANNIGLSTLVSMASMYLNIEKVSILREVSVMLYDNACPVCITCINF